MTIKKVMEVVTADKIADEESLGFAAACIILWSITNKCLSINRIVKKTGFPRHHVWFVLHNLRAAGIIRGYEWFVDISTDNHFENIVEFSLMVLCAEGEVIRMEESGVPYNADEKQIKWADLYNTPFKYCWSDPSNDEEPKTVSKPPAPINNIYPLPKRNIRVRTKEGLHWVEPIFLSGTTFRASMCSVMSKKYEKGSEYEFNVPDISMINGLRKSDTEAIKKKILGEQAAEVVPDLMTTVEKQDTELVIKSLEFIEVPAGKLGNENPFRIKMIQPPPPKKIGRTAKPKPVSGGLMAMQAASRERHGANKPVPAIEAHQKAPIHKLDAQKITAAAKAIKEPEEQKKKPFVRPPAIYSNTSPYGIASEMLMEQIKKSG